MQFGLRIRLLRPGSCGQKAALMKGRRFVLDASTTVSGRGEHKKWRNAIGRLSRDAAACESSLRLAAEGALGSEDTDGTRCPRQTWVWEARIS